MRIFGRRTPRIEQVSLPTTRDLQRASLPMVREYYRWVQTAFQPHEHPYREARQVFIEKLAAVEDEKVERMISLSNGATLRARGRRKRIVITG